MGDLDNGRLLLRGFEISNDLSRCEAASRGFVVRRPTLIPVTVLFARRLSRLIAPEWGQSWTPIGGQTRRRSTPFRPLLVSGLAVLGAWPSGCSGFED